MLDVTNEINDIKAELLSFEKYGFKTGKDFEAELTIAIETAKRERMLVYMESPEAYDHIATVGKANFTEEENNVYYAEVYYAVAEFLLKRDRWDKQMRLAVSESRSQGGSTRSLTGQSGKEAVAVKYLELANSCLSRGGYYPKNKLIARSSIHA